MGTTAIFSAILTLLAGIGAVIATFAKNNQKLTD